jgi:UDP-2,3-diacylglucosamine pyrophosphatase LpxH
MIETSQLQAGPLEEPIRIVSDLHFGHPASIIDQPSQLIPLLAEAKTVIFNGDTVELRYLKGRRVGMHNAGLMRDTCREAGVRPIFINGNHDPILSELCHVDLADGAVLVTHGDLLFHDISPWSHESEIIGEAHSRELASLDEDAFLDFEKRLKASKRAALSIELRKSRLHRDNLSAIRTVLRECWPPWRPLQIFHSWAVTPAKAEALARVFRPRARFILIGHTHFSGCFRRGPRMIINTGSFLPLSGRMTVDLHGGKLIVRPIVHERGFFKAGAPLMEFAATKLLAGEGY